ncbi:hypothetical protein [Adlercreutzia muris]|uniref:hypothetical protein n=1 Tax=Adlercreutzia muris TaxID=1796610 RepID=UPI00136521CE|nr:hypothetical protein [Adlercreutzia muris]NCA32147.1 hypothetical protein [Adlercreutzia muris]
MGIFSRKHIDALVVAPEPEIVERPTVTADELERMVYETYREKLSLAQELAEKDATIARLKEQVDKLNAAETFSRQSESERRRLESEAKRLSDANDHLTEELRQERAKVSARDLKIMQLEKDSAALADERLAEFLRGMADEAEHLGGGWSKARVVEFVTTYVRKIEGGE